MWNPFVSFKYDRKSDGVAFFGIPSSPFPCHSDIPHAYPLHSLLHFLFSDDSFHLITLLHWKSVLCALYCVQSLSPVMSDSLWLVGYSPPGPSVRGIFQARILEWVAISYSRESSWPGDQTRISWVSCIGRSSFTIGATWEIWWGLMI